MLTNSTPPSAVCKNIETAIRMLCPNVVVIELPNIDCVRKCRGIIRIVAETLAACEAGKDIEWKQTFKDETQRKTVPLTTFSALINRNTLLKPLVLSCSEIGVGSTSEDTIDSVKRILFNGREYLSRWVRRFIKMHPEDTHDIPIEDDLTLGNMVSAADTNDTCNQAYKSRRLLDQEVADFVKEKGNIRSMHALKRRTRITKK